MICRTIHLQQAHSFSHLCCTDSLFSLPNGNTSTTAAATQVAHRTDKFCDATGIDSILVSSVICRNEDVVRAKRLCCRHMENVGLCKSRHSTCDILKA